MHDPSAPPISQSPTETGSIPAENDHSSTPLRAPLLFLTVLVIATCGLIYELVAGTLASYVLGDSVTQFSTVIGVYLSAMGVGSYLSKHLQRGLAHRFVDIELAVALVGGTSAPLLFLTFSYTEQFQLVLYSLVSIIGILVGLEIPLLMRILRHEFAFKDLVAQILTFDYLGALVASLMFPLLLMPRLGLIRTSLLFGLLNAVVGLWSTFLLRSQLGAITFLRTKCALVILLLFVALVNADQITRLSEDEMYTGQVIYAHTSPYQRIVVTRDHGSFQLFLNGNLQFSSFDEYRYHEALVHPALSVRPDARRVLVCGGGDGLALRELLRYPQLEEVVLVDLDPAMTGLGENFPPLKTLNKASYHDPRVTVVNDDAMVWLSEQARAVRPFDVVIVDFPDPNNYALGKLYTTRFYRLLEQHLATNGVITVQSTSPLVARQSFWCIAKTLEAAGFHTLPYHLSVPSFGVWGFVMASPMPLEVPTRTRDDLKFLNDASMQAMFMFPKDMERVETEVNRLNNQVLVQYYDTEWKRMN